MQSRTKPKAFLGKRQPDAKRAEFELIAPQKISPETRKATLTFQRGLLLCCGDMNAAIMNPAIMEDS
jgi:hypothetical protein